MSTQVSVLMSVLNGERYLHGAIDSILGQTFTCFEFIVIDDGSNDGTAEILSSYRDPRIRVIRSEQRAGVAATLNKGLGLASGEYIARQDADDISLPDRLQKQWAFLKDHPEVGVLGTWVHLIDEDGRVISDWHPPEHHAMIAWAQLFSSALAHPSIIFRRRVVVDAGGYPQEAAEDFALWAQLAPLTRFANLPETLVLYRRHEDAVTMAHQNLIHNNTLQVLRCTSSTLLNRQTDLIEATYLDAISSGRALASAAEVVAAHALVLEMMRAYLAKHHLSEGEARWVRCDATQRLAALADANRQMFPHEARRIMWGAIRRWPRLLRTRRALRVFAGIGL